MNTPLSEKDEKKDGTLHAIAWVSLIAALLFAAVAVSSVFVNSRVLLICGNVGVWISALVWVGAVVEHNRIIKRAKTQDGATS